MIVGRYTYGDKNINVRAWEPNAEIRIGNFCSIAQNVDMFTGGNHRTDWFTTFPFGHVYQNVFNKYDGHGHPANNGDINIGNDVWIGDSATIMSGVTIGDGAVISAKSLVAKNVEPYTMVGGNPARVIRKRFSDDIIIKLLEIKWWYWEDSLINDFSDVLCSGNFEALCKRYEEYKNRGIVK